MSLAHCMFVFSMMLLLLQVIFFCCHIELLALLLPLNIFCVLCAVLGYMEDVGGCPWLKRGNGPEIKRKAREKQVGRGAEVYTLKQRWKWI